MNKTIGILAHVDAGKTTFSEQLLYCTQSIKQRGRVDHQSSFLDSHDIEKQRGITVFADQAIFEYGESTYYLIDTPGHMDFSPEMERAVQVMDYAIIVISAVEGVEAHTETVWQLLKKYEIPTFFFVNKIDLEGANTVRVLNEIRSQCTGDVINFTLADTDEEIDQELIEFIAERDEQLLEYYMEHGYNQILWKRMLRDLVQTAQLYPRMCGSALQNIGINDFLTVFDQLTRTSYESKEEMAARVFKIRYDDVGTRVTFIKLLSGQLNVRDEIDCGEGIVEKVTQIRRYNGRQYTSVKQANAGELIALVGISTAVVGDGLGTLREKASYDMVPTLRSKVVFEPHVSAKEVLVYFKMLEVEDPTLNVMWEERLQQIQLHVMGKIQLEVLEQLIKERFQLVVSFENPEILYKETIMRESIGYGHFEPLRHYAEVHLRIEPAERNRGVTFASHCHVEDLSVGLQNLVNQHVLEKEHHGLLTGSPLTDVVITLLTGRDHNKHTHGGDFREATYRALRQGLEKADNVLLEPCYHFTICVEREQMGRVLSDVQRAHGTINPPMMEGDNAILTGVVPVATFMDYYADLASFTQGKGKLSVKFGGYYRCHNEQEVIKRLQYDKEADSEYTSSSIFCAKGAGYSVRWDDVEAMMHISK